MSIIDIIKIDSVMSLGCIIQSSSGFGFGLFVIPILLFFGYDLATSVIMVIIASALQKVTAVTYLKKDVPWRELMPYMLVGLVALPLGIYAMFRATFLDKSVVQFIVGALVLILLLLQWKGTIKSREVVPPVWGYIAGFFSGVLNGFANIGGPPLVLWVLAHQWDNRKMRATSIAFALIFVPLQIAMMLYTFGNTLLQPMFKILLLTPVLLLGTWVGLRIGEKISKEHLRVYMQVLLLIIALTSVVKPFLG
ncbi:MAG: sulfite exporter TauE/SafE family protein [bacterium]|nr:sulfite exporter TauE/SafE family protein [bacterium]